MCCRLNVDRAIQRRCTLGALSFRARKEAGHAGKGRHDGLWCGKGKDESRGRNGSE